MLASIPTMRRLTAKLVERERCSWHPARCLRSSTAGGSSVPPSARSSLRSVPRAAVTTRRSSLARAAMSSDCMVQSQRRHIAAAATAGPADSCRWRSINAITLATRDMAASVAFYSKLGLVPSYGGPDSPFTTMDSGLGDNKMHVNLFVSDDMPPYDPGGRPRTWGRVIFYVDDVDAMYKMALAGDLRPDFAPKDAVWGERYFHIIDPAGHELSFARPIEGHPRWAKL
eukprot:gnl/TRDRNA2_/TRDRNA2_60798_c0_seq1.p1 gnl/TRDRNA2_/TRDRNA2_60798_c0~~gnl/TRDRNA2_/TRDRNA2_60798_c0_seq1.p1  ORF type:complete len:228 (-),score=33.02 gnl/TRDRNA2_/TRDRNA2_60798_c0_seq1:69-752(-)